MEGTPRRSEGPGNSTESPPGKKLEASAGGSSRGFPMPAKLACLLLVAAALAASAPTVAADEEQPPPTCITSGNTPQGCLARGYAHCVGITPPEEETTWVCTW